MLATTAPATAAARQPAPVGAQHDDDRRLRRTRAGQQHREADRGNAGERGEAAPERRAAASAPATTPPAAIELRPSIRRQTSPEGCCGSTAAGQRHQPLFPGPRRCAQARVRRQQRLEAAPRAAAQRAGDVVGGAGGRRGRGGRSPCAAPGRGVARATARSRQLFSVSSARRTHDLTVPSGWRSCSATSAWLRPSKNASATLCRCGARSCSMHGASARASAARLSRSSGPGASSATVSYTSSSSPSSALSSVRRSADLRLGLRAAQAVDGAVARDAGQPGQRLALRRIEAARGAPDVDVDLLQHVLGLGAVAVDTQHHRVQMRAGALVQRGEGRTVAEPGAREQRDSSRLRSDQSAGS